MRIKIKNRGNLLDKLASNMLECSSFIQFPRCYMRPKEYRFDRINGILMPQSRWSFESDRVRWMIERNTQSYWRPIYRKLYRTWYGMHQRCYNEKCEGYRYYGKRGIFVCMRWRKSFLAFCLDMGIPPHSIYSIDRINGLLGYAPLNCRWATPETQYKNKIKSS